LLVASTHKSCPDAADGRLLLSLIIDSGQGVHRRIPNTKRRKATSLLSVYWQMHNGCNVSRDLWRRSRPPRRQKAAAPEAGNDAGPKQQGSACPGMAPWSEGFLAAWSAGLDGCWAHQ
jgi:hypothetical protein